MLLKRESDQEENSEDSDSDEEEISSEGEFEEQDEGSKNESLDEESSTGDKDLDEDVLSIAHNAWKKLLKLLCLSSSLLFLHEKYMRTHFYG